ncbi:MAG TPA: DUF2332 family protein [Caulobacterales bacterium]|nr:DUF2332 family protein [Caulobacterales bacterium]
MSNAEQVKFAFELQRTWCEEAGSPFMAQLMQCFADELAAPGPVHDLIGDWPGNPIADALMMRIAGALQAAALSGRDPSLAAQYPWSRADWSMSDFWPAARAFMQREREWCAAFLTSPPQTNETRRSIPLLPGFLRLARLGPLHTLEIGASAGLNLNWDRFRYETSTWSWGEAGRPLMDTEWRGAPPDALDAHVVVASRAGCDRNPIDITDPEQALRLRSYIWADQPDRFTRLDAAIALAKQAGVQPERADAGAWLAARLAAPLPEGVTVVYHSVVWQYLSNETRAAIEAAIASAAARADDAHRLAHLRLEPNPFIGVEGRVDDMGVDMRLWPSGERRLLCKTHGHARWVEQI